MSAHRIPPMPAYLDSPLGIKITRVYLKYHQYFNQSIKTLEHKEPDHPILQFPTLTETESVEASKMINDVDPPKLILAGSGMMQGGRILHHLTRYLPLESTRLLIVGHQVTGSLGRKLLDGEKMVVIHGERIEVKAKILATHAFSSHMDQHQLLKWIKTMPSAPKALFLNHGDNEAREALSTVLAKEVGNKAFLPKYGEGFTLTDLTS